MRINLANKHLKYTFFVTLILTLIAPVLFPTIRLLFFAPFLVICFYQKPLLGCLWSALLAGLIVDLLSSHTHLGLNSLNYCLTTVLLFKHQRHFFADRMSTLSIMTALFAFTSTAVQVLMLPIFEKGVPLSYSWVATDLLLMSLFDGLYAFAVFTLPALATGKSYDHSFS